MLSCAIFDLDGTIIDFSSERILFEHMFAHGEIPITSLLRWSFRFMQNGSIEETKSDKIYLRDVSFDRLQEMASSCFTGRLADRISSKAIDLMNWHRSEGRAIVIMSGSLEILVALFANKLNVDLMFGNSLEVRNGIITGNLAGIHPYAEHKAALTKLMAKEYQFDLSRSYGYGNHHTDQYHLELLGNPVAVNPNRELRRIATDRDWKIDMFHER